MTGYEQLANVIVLQAAKDYRAAMKKLKRKPKNLLAQAEAESIERFFQSEWYRCLTQLDGDMVILLPRKKLGKSGRV